MPTETRYVCGCVVTACRFGTMIQQCPAHLAAGQTPPEPETKTDEGKLTDGA